MTTQELTENTVERLALWEMYTGFWGYTRPIVYALGFIAIVVFIIGIKKRIKGYGIGRKDSVGFDRPQTRLAGLIRYGIGQVRLLRRAVPGIFHLLVFWGFAALFVGTLLNFVDEDFYRVITGGKFIQGNFYVGMSLVLDLLGLLALIGVAIAIVRRYLIRPTSLSTEWMDTSFLIWVLSVLATGFLAEGARIGVVLAHKPNASFEEASFVGYALAGVFGNSPALHQLFWSVHILVSFGFIAMIPYTKGLHIFSALSAIYTRNLGPKEKLATIPNMMERMEAGDDVEMGYKKIGDLTWREILQADACTRCGRCQDVCPTFNTGKALSPMTFIQKIRSHWLKKLDQAATSVTSQKSAVENASPGAAPVSESPFLLEAEAKAQGDDNSEFAISTEELWDCTNCMACGEVCPVFIERVPLIAQMRRELAMEFDESDKECKTFFKNMDVNANPWGMNPGERASWTKKEDVPTVLDNPDFEYLYWIGCMGGYDPRAIAIGKAFVKILKAAKINFAVLGEMEMCCGDSLRRLGNEASFQALVGMFKETVREFELDPSFAGKKVLVTCPHGFNTLKHDYPEFGFQWEVFHHTEFIAELIRQDKIKLKSHSAETAVLHDSCFLSRYNDIVDEPRHVLTAAGLGLVEPLRSHQNTFCCGGGGGRIWLEEELAPEEGKTRINFNRADELIDSGADNIVSCCPQCMMMLDDASKRSECEEKFANKRLVDIAEVVAERLVE